MANYVEDIGMGIAMDEGKQEQDRETISQMEFHDFMDKLIEEE